MGRGLLLAGHGSQRNPHSSASIYEQVERMSVRGGFDQVCAGFWKEEPALSRALDGMDADEVTVVPMFASEGYFTRRVIPRELGLTGVMTRRDGRAIHYTVPAGNHPGIADIIIARAREAGADADWGVVVLAHGTERNPHSARNIHAQVERVRVRGVFAEVCGAFIEQAPRLEGVWEFTRAASLVIVPLFMAAGWHVRETIPADLSLENGLARKGGRRLCLAEAVGTHPGMADVIEELARCR